MVPPPFLITAVPAAPLNVTVNQVERVSGGGSVTITASWIQPPNYELFDIDRYDINVSSTSGIQQMASACGECTNTTVTVSENPGNVHLSTTFTITISARNRCGENGPTAAASYTLGMFNYFCLCVCVCVCVCADCPHCSPDPIICLYKAQECAIVCSSHCN